MYRRIMYLLLPCLFFQMGCLYPVVERVDGLVCDLSARPRDLEPLPLLATLPDQALPSQNHSNSSSKQGEKEKNKQPEEKTKDSELPPPQKKLQSLDTLLPGGPIQQIKLPPLEEGNQKVRDKAIEQLYPALPDIGEDHDFPLGSEGRPLSLSDLQRLALANHPKIKQAVAQVEETRGLAIQAGLAPNPVVGFEADTVFTSGGPGYIGGFIEQTIKTGSKLHLSRAIAAMNMRNAELALYKAQADLASKVRANYFAVLVAQEAVRLNRTLVKITSEVYQVQLEQVKKGGFAAPYEPMYLRALAMQIRGNLIQARNRRTAAWKQLASTIGLPGLPPTQLAGKLDMPIPKYTHKEVLETVLHRHSDLRTAEASVQQAQFQLELAKQTPIPDVSVRVMAQKDRTSIGQLSPSLAIGIPIPVWDRNQGNILAAQAVLVKTREEAHRVRVDLTNSLAEAFERYENNRTLLTYYRDQIIPDLARVYRGVNERYQQEPGGPAANPPTLIDIVTSQQNLAQAIGTYITILGAQWQAVVDVADHLQTFDLFGIQTEQTSPVQLPCLETLCRLPCSHPCSPLLNMHQKIFDSHWPNAGIAITIPSSVTESGMKTNDAKKEQPQKKETKPKENKAGESQKPSSLPRPKSQDTPMKETDDLSLLPPIE